MTRIMHKPLIGTRMGRHEIPSVRYNVCRLPEYDEESQQRVRVVACITPEAKTASSPPRTGNGADRAITRTWQPRTNTSFGGRSLQCKAWLHGQITIRLATSSTGPARRLAVHPMSCWKASPTLMTRHAFHSQATRPPGYTSALQRYDPERPGAAATEIG